MSGEPRVDIDTDIHGSRNPKKSTKETFFHYFSVTRVIKLNEMVQAFILQQNGCRVGVLVNTLVCDIVVTGSIPTAAIESSKSVHSN